MCRLSQNPDSSTSWNPQGLSRSEQVDCRTLPHVRFDKTQRAYNVTRRRVRATISAAEKQYCILWVCICSLSHQAWNVYAPDSQLWPVQINRNIPNYHINGMIFEKKKKALNIICAFWCSVQILSKYFLFVQETREIRLKMCIGLL
jgi:hypothetical protein